MLRKMLFTLVVIVLSLSSTSFALGLGEIKLNSNLNEPLDAEIILLSSRGETADQIIAKLGSSQDFDRSGIERLYFLTRIQFESIQKPNGQLVIRLTTRDAVKEPFLNFLVSLEWPNGRLLREYTILLDPPIFDDAPKTVVTPVQAPRQTTQTTRRSVQPTQTSQPAYDGDLYGLTTSGDTLWGIANKVRPNSSVSVHRAMVALYDANPDAFMRGNINRLKRGAEIRIPSEQAFEQITQREALRLIREHEESWRSGKEITRRVVDTSKTDTTPIRNQNQSESQSGRLQLATEEQTQTGTGGSNAALTEEENLILQQQKQELEDKAIADAERIANLERLLKLKNEQLATLQQNASELQETDTTEQNTTTEETNQDNTETITETKPTPAQQAEPSLMDNLKAGAYNLYLGILAIIIIVAFIIMRARSNTEVSYGDAIKSDTPERKVTPTGLQADDIPDTADEVLADTEEYEAVPSEARDDSDPVGEADIYMAYGKFDQAEGLLLESIAVAPERVELHSKLLECYAEMGAQDKFETHLSSVEEVISTDNELQSMIKEIYQTAWPEGGYYESDSSEDLIDDADVIAVEDDLITEEIESLESEVVDLDDSLEELPSTEDVFGESDDVDDLADDLEFEIDAEVQDSLNNDVLDDDQAESEDDDMDTQLDLAAAYVEMGDFEGAREIVEEVLENGSGSQKAKAQEILNSLDS